MSGGSVLAGCFAMESDVHVAIELAFRVTRARVTGCLENEYGLKNITGTAVVNCWFIIWKRVTLTTSYVTGLAD